MTVQRCIVVFAGLVVMSSVALGVDVKGTT